MHKPFILFHMRTFWFK